MTAEDLLRSALDPGELLAVLERAAAAWDPEADRGRHRPSCGLCLADRPWIADALGALPHAVSHPLVARLDAALQSAEFDERVATTEDAWMHVRAWESVPAEVTSWMRAFDLRAREAVLGVLDVLEPEIATLRESVVEPRLARYLERHMMTEPPWQWTLE